MTNKDQENDKAAELFDLYNAQHGINDVWEWMSEHIDKQIKEAQLELLKKIRAICKMRIRNSDDWRTIADEIDKLKKELGE